MFTCEQKIGILGSGPVGQALASGFLSEGNPVMIGTRDPAKPELDNFKKDNPQVKTGTFNQTASFGDILLLAVPGGAAEAVIQQAGTENFSDKIVIDVTNPISNDAPVDGVLRFFTAPNESLMERIQRQLPRANLVKAFNSVGNALMYKPRFDLTPTMFICGNSEEAKQTVKNIVEAFGWETEDMGRATAARAIEQLCIVWCIPGLLRNQWMHAFKLLR